MGYLSRRFLPRRQVPAGNQDNPKTFSYGIKLLYSPDDGDIEYVPSLFKKKSLTSSFSIIFIHGLTGDRDATWTARDATDPWPKALLPHIIPTARILTFGYDANVADWKGMVSQNRIANHATNLLAALSTYRENDGTALLSSNQRPEPHLRNILHYTRGIVFLGTPHHGSGLARWAETLSQSVGLIKKTNSKIIGVLKRDSEVLARIQDGFHTMVKSRSAQGLPPIQITCFYEELPLPGVGLVVPQDSAILPGYIPIGIHGNHMDMTKFADSTDPGFLAVCGEMRRWIKNENSGSKYHASQPPANSAPAQTGSASQYGNNNRQYNSLGDSQKTVGGSYYEVNGDQHLAYRRIPFPRNDDIVDRTAIITELDVLFQSPKSHSAALWGLGGSGKTQVALEFAWRQSEDGACSVFWVHADTQATFAQDYKAIARTIGLPDDITGEKLLTAVRDRIESLPRWLLILDNADDLTVFGVGPAGGPLGESPTLCTYVPQGPNGKVLWTSRDNRIVGTLVSARRGIQVGRMSADEAFCLLGKLKNDEGENSNGEESDAWKLLEELQWLPLAISQASAYMRRTSMPIHQYLSRLLAGQERWRVLKAEQFDRYRRPNVPNSFLETWSISVERIRQDNEMAYKILQVIAYVNNENIPIEIMAAVHTLGKEIQEPSSFETQDQVMEAITRLREFSFLSVREEEGFEQQYEIHKLVQEATRYGLRVRSTEDVAYFSNAALQIVTSLFPGSEPDSESETWRECEKYVTHAVEVCKWAEICEGFEEVFNLLDEVSLYFHHRGRWMDIQPVDQRLYELRQQMLGESHPDTIRSLASLASTYNEQGRYREAEPMKVKALELRRQVLGEKHPDTIWSLASLATIYHEQGRYSEAEPIEVKALELRRQVLGEKHPDTIRSLANLATTYYAQGQYSETETIEVEALELRRQVLGEKHPDTIRSLASLATTYYAQGRYSEAEPMEVKALELRRQVLGEKHPDTIRSIDSLSSTYRALGRHKEAETLEVKASELQEHLLDNNPVTI
ncbi:unnamed protein product [Penicillium nalgiovense]|nr:unnamed protein product [Penicillium nalgiovense]CAG8274351.1 unnamed protein product [Penicillium nalgiovense]CAG8353148.1 unnamed protein product [Penicillium nalgiovense]CAG8354484.1 unnamed protein product [Penicillium nalgiovense]